jgi:AcrR family transcriptional regulator
MKSQAKPVDPRTAATRERIVRAAAELFAQHGFHGVGVRDIAREAGVNLAMISYHFDGKVGVLKEIVRACLDAYSREVHTSHAASGPVEAQVLAYIRAVIRLFRVHGALALVAFDVIPADPAEVWRYKVRLTQQMFVDLSELHGRIGLDVSDMARLSALKSVFAGILAHFQGLHVARGTPSLRALFGKLDDDFYEQFARHLTRMYLAGLKPERVRR